jgi:cobalt-zinc-cadmium resistance protein CzcA
LFSLIILVLTHQDANLLSIGAVDFGIIVDGAVILVENIFRNFQGSSTQRTRLIEKLHEGAYGPNVTEQTLHGSSRAWTDRLRLIYISALQVDRSVMFSVAITVAAFIPLFTMQGVEGQIFGPMARTYGYALAGALIATFTITPVLASFVLPDHVEEVETAIVRFLRRAYEPVLAWALDNRKVMVGIGAVFLIAVGLIGSRLGSEFLPALEEGNYWICASLPATATLDAGTEATRKMREILLRHPEIVTVVSQHGRPDNGSDASSLANVELFAPLKPLDQWPAGMTKDKLTEELQKEFTAELPGVAFNFSQYIQDNVEESISGVKGANSVKIMGPNLDVIEKIAEQVKDQMSKVGGHGPWHLPCAWPAQSEHQGRPGKGGPLRPQHRRRQHGHSVGPWRSDCHDSAGRRSPVRPDGPRRIAGSRQHREGFGHQGRLSDAGRRCRLYPAAGTGDDHPRYRRLLHLS